MLKHKIVFSPIQLSHLLNFFRVKEDGGQFEEVRSVGGPNQVHIKIIEILP